MQGGSPATSFSALVIQDESRVQQCETANPESFEQLMHNRHLLSSQRIITSLVHLPDVSLWNCRHSAGELLLRPERCLCLPPWQQQMTAAPPQVKLTR